MPLEDVAVWIVGNAVPLAVGALIAATSEILFKIFIWDEYVAPSFKYQTNYVKNRIKKWLHNTTVEISYSSRTTDLESHRIDKETIRNIADFLREHKIYVSERGDIVIENYNFGKMKLSGTIEFATTSSPKGEILKDFDITLNAQIRYNSMNDEIPAIIQGIGKLKEYVSVALNIPIEYSDSMSCKLTRLVVELSEAMKDLKIQYVKFGGEIELSMHKDRVVFHAPLDASVVVPQLRKLVVLYA